MKVMVSLALTALALTVALLAPVQILAVIAVLVLIVIGVRSDVDRIRHGRPV